MNDAPSAQPTLEAPLRESPIDLSAPQPAARGPLRQAWRSFRRHKPAMAGLAVLVALYFIVIFADFIAPYDFDNQARDLQWAPHTALHFSDDKGGFWPRPFIYPVRGYVDENFNIRQDETTSQRCYLRFFVQGDAHRFLGLIPTHVRLFGFDPPATALSAAGDVYYSRYYLLGADLAGRDIFSRICYGSRVSMTIGLLGASIVLLIGLFVGGVSGYFGGPVDNILQRLCEMIMLLPSFYLLLMLRFAFPPSMGSVQVYFAVILILSGIGWASLARVIRGMVLSIKSQDFIQAGRAVGLTHLRLIVRHVLPNTMGYVIVAVTLSIPSYILGESALSLLGLGIIDPVPSWGNMLQKAMDITELQQHPWVLWPGLFIFLAVMAFNLVGDGLRDALDPRGSRQ